MTFVNTFGPSSSQQFQLVDVRCVYEHRERFRRDAFPELMKANSYYSMAGRWPDVGWLLIDRNSYNQFSANIYGTNFELIIGDFVNAPLTLSGLTIVQARCVTRGLASDPNAIYLVQVTNNEGVLYNPWFQFPLNAQYNVVAPAYAGSYLSNPPDGPTYYSGSMNGGLAWTWNTMVQDLWNRATILGVYPGLPITPPWAPEGWIFVGVPLWEALNRVMEYLGLAISGSSGSLTITVPGATDSTFQALINKFGVATSPNYCLEDSMEYLDQGSGRVPSAVTIFFHRRNIVYGTEETVRHDAQQWQNTPAYSVTFSAPTKFISSAGTACIWADFSVRHDQDGNPVAADVATANTIASTLVGYYFNTIFRGTAGYMRDTYSGVIPFTTGSQVDGVRWYNTGYLDATEDMSAGWRTEIIRGYIWDDVTFTLSLKGLTGV